jgi:DNA replication initiation complex subunit (GINS family)
MQGKMVKERKSRVFNPRYVSPSQGILPGFEHPFDRELDPSNRWVVLSRLIPWDDLCNDYVKQTVNSGAGRKPVNPRIVLGSLIIKYMLNLDDRETVDQISENIYMQYFLGYPSFTSDKPFDSSLFVDIRKRLSMDVINNINEKIVRIKTLFEESSNKQRETSGLKVSEEKPDTPSEKSDNEESPPVSSENGLDESKDSPCQLAGKSAEIHKGRLLIDATVCPQNIAYPTDLDLLSAAREKSEQLIDSIYDRQLHGDKPRTYRKIARKEYLHTAQKKKKSKKQIRSAIRKQLGYLCRNIRSLHRLLDAYTILPFNKHERKYFYVIQTLFDQQLKMWKTRTHTIEDRIVSIHQPHVRPIVRGKSSAPVEFGPGVRQNSHSRTIFVIND